MSERTLSLLNVFEVVADGESRRLLCVLDPVLAGSKGIDTRWTLGEIKPGPDGGFDSDSFQFNPDFVATLTDYMNEVAAHSPEIVAQAKQHPSGWLYVMDPRHPDQPDEDPPATELLGCFAVDEAGQIAPNSFQYNRNHVWFEPAHGVSGVLSDRRFYKWLHLDG